MVVAAVTGRAGGLASPPVEQPPTEFVGMGMEALLPERSSQNAPFGSPRRRASRPALWANPEAAHRHRAAVIGMAG